MAASGVNMAGRRAGLTTLPATSAPKKRLRSAPVDTMLPCPKVELALTPVTSMGSPMPTR